MWELLCSLNRLKASKHALMIAYAGLTASLGLLNGRNSPPKLARTLSWPRKSSRWALLPCCDHVLRKVASPDNLRIDTVIAIPSCANSDNKLYKGLQDCHACQTSG